EGLIISSDLLQFAPLPGLEEAAKTLLVVWEACEDVDTNRLACLRLTERCATLLLSVRCEIAEAGDSVADELSVPVGKLCDALHLVLEFLQRQLRRSFLTRYLRRDEIQTEIAACDKAISDVMSMFGFSIQMRTLKHVLATADESRRFAEEVQHQLESGFQWYDGHGQDVMAQPIAAVPTLRAGNALGLSTGTPPPAYPCVLSSSGQLASCSGDSDAESDERTPMQSMFPATCRALIQTAPVTVEAGKEEAEKVEGEDRVAFPLHTLTQLHATQNASDSAADDAALRAILQDVIRSGGGAGAGVLRVMQTGSEALMDGIDVAVLDGGVEGLGHDSSCAAVTNIENRLDLSYAIDTERQIGAGTCSKVYLGRWQQQTVAIKVLATTAPRSLDLCELEVWRSLRHHNVLPLYEASGASGPYPWFFVNKFCSGGSLLARLKAAKDGLDLLRYIHEIAKGMAYLHEKGVLHGDLKAGNVLVDEEGHCVISDYGQWEMKSEVYKLSGQPLPRGRLQWRAPELLRGENRLTTAVDVYAFAVCCVEILGMGDPPWMILEDSVVAALVLDEDQRPGLPPSRHTSTVAPLITACWKREPDSRPSFTHIVRSIGGFRGCEARNLGDISPSMNPLSLPSILQDAIRDSWTDVSPADECYERAPEVTPVDTRVEIPVPSPTSPLNRRASKASVEFDDMLVTNTELCGTVMHTSASQDVPRVRSETSLSSTSSSLESVVKLKEMARSTVGLGDCGSPVQSKEWTADTRNERRYRLVASHTHQFHPSLTLPLWSPTHVALGAIGYLSKPKGEFVTLLNALDPFRTASGAAKDIKSMHAYGKLKIETRPENKRSVVRRGLDALSSFLASNLRNNELEKVARRYSFPLKAGQKTAYICTESTIYRCFINWEAPKAWFKKNIDVILKEYAPHHPIRKEDLCLVVATLGAPDYALFVSRSHPGGQAHFNVLANRKAGQPWGRFTTWCDGKMSESAPFASKVSTVRGNRGNRNGSVLGSVKWDTLMVARLGFKLDGGDPVLL
ncbi:hypothetical protein F5I97DRAFT_1982693, partial [Phlebopus sp. FC_14]